jgi:hypothetical protein
VPGLVLQSCRDPMGTNLASHWAWESGRRAFTVALRLDPVRPHNLIEET